MKILFATVTLLALTIPAFSQLPGQPVPLPLPEKVEQNLPSDVPGQAVRLVDGCYVFVYDGEVIPILDANEEPVCR